MSDGQARLRLGPLRQLAVRLLLLLALAGPASAAERRVDLSSFERIRVEGAFRVTVVTGRSPHGVVTGDPRGLDGVELHQDGATLVVRGPMDEGRAAQHGAAATVTLTTPRLASAAMLGGGVLTVTGGVTGGRAQRLDLSVTGPGSISWTGADAEQANALVIGNGAITLSGHAGTVRLLVNGAGKIAADTLQADSLTIRVDGPGDVTARARYTAAVTNTGLGRIDVAGTAKCEVKSVAGGPVTCGAGR